MLQHRIHALLVDPENPSSPLDPNLVREAAALAHEDKGIRITNHNVELDEEGTRIALTIVDTPGFGDGLDNDNW